MSGARLAQRSSEQQSSCGSPQDPLHFVLNSFFAYWNTDHSFELSVGGYGRTGSAACHYSR